MSNRIKTLGRSIYGVLTNEATGVISGNIVSGSTNNDFEFRRNTASGVIDNNTASGGDQNGFLFTNLNQGTFTNNNSINHLTGAGYLGIGTNGVNGTITGNTGSGNQSNNTP
ncbi:MAG: hypothetical protein AAGF67_15565 [Verrucomicrobiota bacterium]